MDFTPIRPVLPEELPAAWDSLFADPAFCDVLGHIYPGIPLEALHQRARSCRTNLEAQQTMIYPVLQKIVAEHTTSLTFSHDALPDKNDAYTFISNHRDIVLDPALLSLVLLEAGFRTTVEIAIGDNLLIFPWIRTLVRINKAFIVERSVSGREMLTSSQRLSAYMHHAVQTKRENVWIAQREGRAKDSDDRTQEALIRMLALSGEGSHVDRIRSLNLVPLTISYQLDPCDHLKAAEYQQKRDIPDFRKSKADDLENMSTGIFGDKGAVHYHAAPPVNTWLDEIAALPKKEFFTALAQRIDREIHRHYALTPFNYAAADLLSPSPRFSEHYTAADVAALEHYVAAKIARIRLPQPDVPFLRERILTMYANPARNNAAVLEA